MDEKGNQLIETYKWETDAELERKRMIYLRFIVGQTQDDIRAKAANVDDNREMYEALSKIIRRRERNKRVSGEVFRWLGFAGPFILGLIASGLLLDRPPT